MHTSIYDPVAHSFDLHRALPGHVPGAIRTTVLGAVDAASRPRLLDLGAGTGRIGRSFVASGDDYVGVDLSLGMLCEFARRRREAGRIPRLVHADGEHLPFRDETFDAIMLIQVVGAARNWRALVTEARRVLHPVGALIVGHAAAPADGVDAQMKLRLASLLDEMGVASCHTDTRGVVQPWLESVARTVVRVGAAEWSAERAPRGFLDRQATGARFSKLPEAVQEEALRRLSTWAAATFGSVDTTFFEQHAFELQVFRF